MKDPKTAHQILDACLSEEPLFLDLLEKLVSIETPPHNPKMHKEIFTVLQKELTELNFSSQIYPGETCGGQLFAKAHYRTAGCQLLLGHIDTVWPIGTLDGMPFGREGNKVAGPGIYDMKAGVVMMLTALKVLQRTGHTPTLAPVLFINSDEETGSRESKTRIVRLARVMNRAFVLEPSLDRDGKIKTRRKGVGHFDIRVKGRSSHAGLEPEKGRSAILELSYLIQKLFELNDPENGITVNVGKIDGGIRTNIVAAESSADVDVRVLSKKDARQVEKRIRSLTASTQGVTVEIDGGFGRDPMVQNAKNRRLWKAAKQCAEMLDLKLRGATSGGASDGNLTSQYTATLDGLGAVGEGAHAPEEKIYLEETLQRTALLALLLLLPELEHE